MRHTRIIVTHYGGRIWAQNGAHSGTEIHVTLPGEDMRVMAATPSRFFRR